MMRMISSALFTFLALARALRREKRKRDSSTAQADRAVYHWTFIGGNTGPGGTGHRVRFSGYEVWKFGKDGLIAESQGHFDAADYQRQLEGGVERKN